MSDRARQLQTFVVDLLRLSRIYRREVNRRLGDHAISDSRALPVLQIARAGGGMRQGVLAEELGLEGPSLVRLLDQLGAAGLVERRDDPKDRRAKTLHVTDAGAELAERIEIVLQSLRAEVMGEVSQADLEATLRTFAAFDRALDALAARARES